MPTDLATLGVKVVPTGIKETEKLLRALAKAGKLTEAEVDDLTRQFREMDNAIDSSNGKMVELGQKMGMVGAAISGLAITGVAVLGKHIIETGAKFETLGVQLNTVTGSVEAGNAAFEWIQQKALDMPYQVENLTEQFVLLKSMGLDPMDGTLQAIGDQAAALGGGQQKLMEITLALGKAYSKGKIEGEEWNMMAEKGVPIAKYFGEALGRTEEEILAMRTAGELGRREIKLLIDQMGEMTSGASVALMDTFEGKWSNLQDTISSVLNQIAQDGGVLDAATEAVSGLIDVLNSLDPEALALFAETSIDGLRDLLPEIESVTQSIKYITVGMASAVEMVTAIQLDLLDDKGLLEAKNEIADYTRRMAELKKQFADPGASIEQLAAISREYQQLAKWRWEAAKKSSKLFEQEEKLEARHSKTQNLIQDMIHGRKEQIAVQEEVADSVEDLGDAVEDAADVAEEYAQKITKLAELSEQAKKKLDEHNQGLEEQRDAFEDVMGTYRDMEADPPEIGVDVDLEVDAEITAEDEREIKGAAMEAAEVWANELERGIDASMHGIFGNALADGWYGEFDSFVDNAVEGFSDFGMRSAQTWMDQFMDGMNFSDFENNIEGLGTGQRTMGALGGAAGVYQTYTQGPGGAQGAISGALSGAVAGSYIAPGIGTAIGAVVGGLAGLLGGGGDEDPLTSIYATGQAGGAFSQITAKHQGLRGNNEAITSAQREISQMFTDVFGSWREVVKQFKDPSLWAGFEFPTIQLDGVKMTLAAALQYLADTEIPDVMQEAFSEMLVEGFSDLGVTDQFVNDLFRELDVMQGDQKLATVTSVIQALQGIGDINETTFESISENLTASTMDQFHDLTQDMVDQIGLLGMGFDDLSIAERADEIVTLAQNFGSFSAAVQAVMAEIQAARRATDSMFGSSIESIMLEDMSTYDQAHYYADQIEELMGQLSITNSASEVQRISKELDQYIMMFQGLDLSGTGLFPGQFGNITDLGMSWNELFIQMLEEAQETARQRYGELEDKVRDDFELVRQQALSLGLSFAELQGYVEDYGIALQRETIGDTGENDTGIPDDADTTGTGSGGPSSNPVGPDGETPVGLGDETDPYGDGGFGGPFGKSGTIGGDDPMVIVDFLNSKNTDVLDASLSESVRQSDLLAEQASLLRQIATNGSKPIIINLPAQTRRTSSAGRPPSGGGAVY